MDPGVVGMLMFGGFSAFVIAAMLALHYLPRDKEFRRVAAQEIKRALRHAKQVRIADFREGSAAKIVGKLAYTEHTLTAPLTGRQCAFYDAVVEEYTSNGDDKSSSWSETMRVARFADFFLEDSSGHAVVRMDAAAKFAVVSPSTSDSVFSRNATPEEVELLRKSGQRIHAKAVRSYEGVLMEGEQVAVYGHGVWETDPDPNAVAASYRRRPRRLVMRSNRDAPLLVSDDPSTME